MILVDNSPAAMILPSSVFDIIEEADDYYFPAGDRHLPAAFPDGHLPADSLSDAGVASVYAESGVDPRLAGVYSAVGPDPTCR